MKTERKYHRLTVVHSIVHRQNASCITRKAGVNILHRVLPKNDNDLIFSNLRKLERIIFWQSLS